MKLPVAAQIAKQLVLTVINSDGGSIACTYPIAVLMVFEEATHLTRLFLFKEFVWLSIERSLKYAIAASKPGISFLIRCTKADSVAVIPVCWIVDRLTR